LAASACRTGQCSKHEEPIQAITTSIPAVQKADTTEYVVDAFKLRRDAQTEDLLRKLPGVSVSHSPGMLNGITYATTSWPFGGGLAVGTNVSRDVDGHLSYNATYTASRNTLTQEAWSSYLTHSARLRSTLTFWEVIVLRNEASYTLRTGLTGGRTRTASFGR
jgi:hypothetical protein